MSRHLVAAALGPVQEFIAAGRKTRDLWFGSTLLGEMSRAAAIEMMSIYDRAAKESGLGEKDIVADITGGTKLMSIGMALAGLPTERDIQYLKPKAGYRPPPVTEDQPPPEYTPVVMDVSFSLAADVLREERGRLRETNRNTSS